MANTTCCTWLNASVEVEDQLYTTPEQETQIYKIVEQRKAIGVPLQLLWVLGNMALKCTPNVGNNPASGYHNSLPGVLMSQKV